MALMEGYLLLGFLVLINVLAPSHGVIASQNSTSLGRSSFPAGFIFGTASSAYQYEGAAREGGRGLSIWDTFTHKYPGKIKGGGGNGDVAIDFYHRYKEDIGIMKKMGADAFRFSISWPRVLPRGKISGVNKEGIAFYNSLINELLFNGIQPFVTLFHWDLPQVLEDEYGGLLSPHIVGDFRDYADLCFREFGDRVKHWITLNEPLGPSDNGHAKGTHAPGRCSPWVSATCAGGDSATEPYLVTHHQLLSHAAAVKVYRDKYQVSQKGKIGITLVTNWMVPYSNEKFDKHAAQRSIDFVYGWFMDPLAFGEYPRSMRALVGKRLPRFTEEQSKMVKWSFDFLGLNYYTANYAAHDDERNGVPIGSPTGADWFRVYPRGFTDLLLYTKKRYKSPVIYITENGICEDRKSDLSLKEALSDKIRIDYHLRHLSALLQAIKAGVDVRGYLAWSLFDDFEWDSGYTLRFGLNYIDFKDGLKRYPKQSALWFKKFLQG